MKITCLDGYYINDFWDYPNENGVVLAIADDKKAVQDWDFFDCREHKKITGDLLDDVGGIGGFVEMLKTLHGNDQEEAASMREWANGQGWFGKSVKVENML